MPPVRSRRFAVVSLTVLLAGVVAWVGITGPTASSQSVFLRGGLSAEWIKVPDPPSLMGFNKGVRFAAFRTRFDSATTSAAPVYLHFRALKVANVYLNGQAIYSETQGPQYWRTRRSIDISFAVKPGPNELQFNVANDFGPVLVLAAIPQLGVRSGDDWECSRDGSQWIAAMRSDRAIPPIISREFPDAAAAFARSLPYTLPVGILLLFASALYSRPGSVATFIRRLAAPVRVRWFALTVMALIGLNNLMKLELFVGNDSVYHYDYIRFLIEHKRVPLANEGPQMFRGPLPYVAYALLHYAFTGAFSVETADKVVRVFSIACHLAIVQVCYMTLRTLFPSRPGLQSLGLLVGSFLPVLLYTCQVVGDEPLTGALGSLTVYTSVRIVADPANTSWRSIALLGAVIGLSLLCKMSALLLAAASAGAVAWWWRYQDRKAVAALQAITAFMVPPAALSAWFFTRNYWHFGKFVVGGWDSAIGVQWWQDPGFHTIAYFTRFGEALRYPVYSALTGFWDGLYSSLWADAGLSGIPSYSHRPPWNDALMLSGVWWALVPSTLIAAGAIRSARARWSAPDLISSRAAATYCVAIIVLFFVAMIHHAVSVPYYSSVKASYMIACAPAFAVLAALGSAAIMSRAGSQAILVALLGCWAAAAAGAYLVI